MKKEYNLTDIHFHTSDSYDTINEYDYEEMAKTMKSVELKILAKTDHDVIGFDNYINQYEIFNRYDIKYLPGIEVKVGNQKIHWLFIFNDIEFLKKNKIGVHIGKAFEKDLYEKIYEYDINKNIVDEAKNFSSKAINLEKFINLISEYNLSVIAIPHLNKSGGYFYKKKDAKEIFELADYIRSQIIFGFESKSYLDLYKNKIELTNKNIEKLLEKNEDVGGRYEYLELLEKASLEQKKYGYSLVYGSDFHLKDKNSYNSYNELIKQLFYCRSLPSFEGLKISLSDQDSRIVSYDEMENINKSERYIKKITFKNDNKTNTIKFGSNLNSLIGLRGSGKSFILKSILSQNENYNILSKKIYDFKIYYDDVVYGTEELPLSEFVKNCDYISQKNSQITDSSVTLYSSLMDAPYNIDKFIDILEQKTEVIDISENNPNINQNIDIFNKLFKNIKSLDDILVNGFLLNETELRYINNNSESKIIELFKSYNKRIDKNIETKKVRITELKNTNIVLQQIIKFEYDGNEKVKISDLSDVKKRANKVLDELIQRNDDLIGIYEDFIQKYKKRKKISDNCCEKINKELSHKSKIFQENLGEYTNLLTKMTKIKIENKKLRQKEFIEIFNDKKYIDSNIFLEFIRVTSFDVENNNSNKVIGSLLNSNQINLPNINDFSNFTDDLLLKIHKVRNQVKFKNNIVIEYPKYKNSIYQKNIEDNKNIFEMSPGERTDLILDLILSSKSTKPLIIDQPEDDLDNMTIYSKLVKHIRKTKFNRQIIIISHNGNIVINADSDTVIFCNRENDSFKFYNLRFDDENRIDYIDYNNKKVSQNCLEICTNILEGGKKAVRQRTKILGFKNIYLGDEEND